MLSRDPCGGERPPRVPGLPAASSWCWKARCPRGCANDPNRTADGGGHGRPRPPHEPTGPRAEGGGRPLWARPPVRRRGPGGRGLRSAVVPSHVGRSPPPAFVAALFLHIDEG